MSRVGFWRSEKVGKYHRIAQTMGVQKQTLTPGDGCTFPKTGQFVVIHYEGMLECGKVFDSSRERNSTFRFQIGQDQVIKGWDEGIKKMSLGEKAKLICSPDYGYGTTGFPGVIPPNATLYFEVELVALQ